MFDYLGYKKSGFTLSEVLITLGVIGVVAALTIPSLSMSYQRRIWESKLKKVYAIATNACERMLVEEHVSRVNETEIYGQYVSESGLTDTEIKKYFKTMKSGGVVANKGYAIYIPDGAVLYLVAENNGFRFYTDVTGESTGPNEVGKDEFEFRLDQNCSYDGDIPSGSEDTAAGKFKEVIENDWAIH